MSFATKEQLQALVSYMASQLNASGAGVYSPVGTVISYMGTTAPADYLICDGTLYNIADYPMLANHFAGHFGSKNFFGGDGITTFAVPDLRGEFLRGIGTNGHENQGSGASVGVHQDGTEHLVALGGPNGTFYGPGDGTWDVQPKDHVADSVVKISTHMTTAGGSISGNTDWAMLYTSRPTNTSVLYCIAYRDSFPAMEQMYSTEEKVVGRWIDGKPVYQKVIPFTVSNTSGSWVQIISFPDISPILYTGSLISPEDGQILSVPYGGGSYFLVEYRFGNLRYAASSSWMNNSQVYLIIQYTKTTDSV